MTEEEREQEAERKRKRRERLLRWVDFAAFVGAVLMIGIGVAIKDPAWSLVVVGSIVLATVLASRIWTRAATPKPTGEPE